MQTHANVVTEEEQSVSEEVTDLLLLVSPQWAIPLRAGPSTGDA